MNIIKKHNDDSLHLIETKRDLLLIERVNEKRYLPVFGIKYAKKIKKVKTKIKFANFFIAKINDETKTGHAIAA